jgi:hypothetical protein
MPLITVDGRSACLRCVSHFATVGMRESGVPAAEGEAMRRTNEEQTEPGGPAQSIDPSEGHSLRAESGPLMNPDWDLDLAARPLADEWLRTADTGVGGDPEDEPGPWPESAEDGSEAVSWEAPAVQREGEALAAVHVAAEASNTAVYVPDQYEELLREATRLVVGTGVPMPWEEDQWLRVTLGPQAVLQAEQARPVALPATKTAVTAVQEEKGLSQQMRDGPLQLPRRGTKRSWLAEVRADRQSALEMWHLLMLLEPEASRLGRQRRAAEVSESMVIVSNTMSDKATNTNG